MVTVSLLLLVLGMVFGIYSSLKSSEKNLEKNSFDLIEISKLLKILNNSTVYVNDNNLIFHYKNKKYKYIPHRLILNNKPRFENVYIKINPLKRNLYEIKLEIKKIKFKINIIKKGEIYDKEM